MTNISKIKNFIIEQIKIIWDKNKNINPSIISVYHEYEIATNEIIKKFNIRFQELENTLQDLREEGFIYDYKFISLPTGRICKIQPSKDFLFLYKQNKEKDDGQDKLINSITCTKSETSNKYSIAINNDFLNALEVDGNQKYWGLFWKIAEGNYLPINGNKGFLDNFNTNKGSKIYTRTGRQLTKILKIEGSRIYPNIKIEIISKKAFETRKNKAKQT